MICVCQKPGCAVCGVALHRGRGGGWTNERLCLICKAWLNYIVIRSLHAKDRDYHKNLHLVNSYH